MNEESQDPIASVTSPPEEISTTVENADDGSTPQESAFTEQDFQVNKDLALGAKSPIGNGITEDSAVQVSRPIQFGDEGEEVEEVQFLLGTWGKLHEDYQTGKFCATTRDAVKAFQGGQVYPATGEVDEATLVALRGQRVDHEAVPEVTAEEDQPAA